MQTVDAVSFSGGRTSAKMLRELQQRGMLSTPCHILFANTGKERNETLDFIQRCEESWGLKVTWLEYVVDWPLFGTKTEHSFRVVDYYTAKRRTDPDTPFDEHLKWKLMRPTGALPNPIQRSCTGQLKMNTMKRYLKSMGLTEWTTAIGIRADEWLRSVQIKKDCPQYITPLFPLIDWGVTEKDVLAFWKQQTFDLHLEPHEGNCDLCFLKAKWKILSIMQKDRRSSEWWEQWEERFTQAGRGAGGRFRKDRGGYATLSLQADTMPDEDIGCSCMEGAWSDCLDFGEEG